MRLYACLLLVAALHAHAATIPVAQSEKKITAVVSEDFDNLDNVSLEEELTDQGNTIKDVENKLRVKPEDIPVKVIIEDAQPVLKIADDKEDTEEINRPVPDLRNPGPPQRQEHETQNPEHYGFEQQAIANFKQSVNEAQNALKQRFQGFTDSIQKMLQTNEPVQKIQQSIQTLRESFSAEINKLNGTVQNYLGMESHANEPAADQTKANFQEIEKGLKLLKDNFNTGVNTLSDGFEVVAYLRADGENNPSSGSSPAPVNPSTPSPIQGFLDFMQGIRDGVMNAFQNMIAPFNQTSNATDVPAGAQSDSQGQSPSQPGIPFLQNWSWPNFQGLTQIFNGSNFFNADFISKPLAQFAGLFNQGKPTSDSQQGTQTAQAASKPSEPTNNVQSKPEIESKPQIKDEKPVDPVPVSEVKPVADTQAAAVTPTGPIRQILQNNPISKGIANAVQRIQNMNNHEKPRDVKKTEEQIEKDKEIPESETKGHDIFDGGHHGGDNIDVSVSGIKANENVVKEPETLPEVQKPKEDEVKEHKTDEVLNKTE